MVLKYICIVFMNHDCTTKSYFQPRVRKQKTLKISSFVMCWKLPRTDTNIVWCNISSYKCFSIILPWHYVCGHRDASHLLWNSQWTQWHQVDLRNKKMHISTTWLNASQDKKHSCWNGKKSWTGTGWYTLEWRLNGKWCLKYTIGPNCYTQ
jgi:hypothetical protein